MLLRVEFEAIDLASRGHPALPLKPKPHLEERNPHLFLGFGFQLWQSSDTGAGRVGRDIYFSVYHYIIYIHTHIDLQNHRASKSSET